MYADVVVVGRCRPIPQHAVEEAERQLGVRFPHGYREYIIRFGEGVLGGSFIRIYPPQRIVCDLVEWRARIEEYWFWDQGAAVLAKEQALECIVFADTINGDEIVFHPNAPDEIFVLPRDSGGIFAIGPGVPSAIEWCCSSGILTERFDELVFEPRRE
ncbi:MAG: SMI1/KNR4 family protein [Hyphomicrobiaceae bacterium]|nr:SMI1/KNR4 family protein [Hyphomicrobiaceae bacterium]